MLIQGVFPTINHGFFTVLSTDGDYMFLSLFQKRLKAYVSLTIFW